MTRALNYETHEEEFIVAAGAREKAAKYVFEEQGTTGGAMSSFLMRPP